MKKALFEVIDAGPINGRYEVEDIIDEGGMGLVFRAMDLGLKRQVALKIFVGDFDTDASLDDAYDLYLREAQLAASLNHPNIVAAYDLGIVEASPDRNPFIAMEYIQGKTLADLTRGQIVPLPELLQIFVQVGRALAHAHSQPLPILHRDVKPRNILVGDGGSDNGRVVLIDFGFSKRVDGAATALGVFKGSASYMAPELLKAYFSNSSAELVAANHPKADLYSFGATIYRVLTGTNPVAGQAAFEVLQAMPQAVIVPPSQVRPAIRHDIPPELDQLVLQLLAKDPAQRMASADVAVEKLAAILNDISPSGWRAIEALKPTSTQLTDHQVHHNDVEQLLQLRRARTRLRPSQQVKQGSSMWRNFTQSGVLVSVTLLAAYWIFKPRLFTPMTTTPPSVATTQQQVATPTTKTATVTTKPPRRRLDEKMLVWKDETPPLKQGTNEWGVPSGTIIHDLYLVHTIVSRESPSPVRAKLRTAFTLANKTILPRETLFIGEATPSADSERILIQFHQATTPNGTEITFEGTALMPDGTNGLIGKEAYTPLQVLVKRGF